MTARIDWDSEAADSESATIPQKLLNTVVPLHNELAELEAKFNAATDIDAAVADEIESASDEESLKLKEQIDKANALIAKNNAVLAENARKSVLANIDPDFDEAKYRAKHNDLRNELLENGKSIRGTFKILGYVSSELSPAGRESNFKGETPEGELLLKVLSVPKLGSDKADSTGKKTDPAVVEFNKNAKTWAKEHGMQVADKGALSKEVKEAYSKATGTAIPQ